MHLGSISDNRSWDTSFKTDIQGQVVCAKLVRNSPLQKRPVDWGLAFDARISGIVWVAAWTIYSGQTQCAYVILPDLLPENYREITKKTVSKSQKIKPFWKEKLLTFRIWGNSKVPIGLLLTLSPRTLFCHCISSNDFSPTSLQKRSELIQIFKAIATGCEVGFAFDRCLHKQNLTDSYPGNHGSTKTGAFYRNNSEIQAQKVTG